KSSKPRLNSITPVEYVNTIRRFQPPKAPKLEQTNKKLVQGVDKLKTTLSNGKQKMTNKKALKKPRNPGLFYLIGSGSLFFSLFMFGAQDELIRISKCINGVLLNGRLKLKAIQMLFSSTGHRHGRAEQGRHCDPKLVRSLLKNFGSSFNAI